MTFNEKVSIVNLNKISLGNTSYFLNIVFRRFGCNERRGYSIGNRKKRRGEFLDFLHWLLEDIYGDRDHLYLFLDNCSIYHTKTVCEYIDSHKDQLTMIWNTTYAPNLNLIERFWGHLKRSVIHNYYFQTVDNLEKVIMKAVTTLDRQKNHPLRLHLKTVQDLLKAA